MKLISSTFLFLFFLACSSNKDQASLLAVDETNSAKNKKVVKRVYSEMANKRKYGLVDSLYANNMIDHSAFENQQQGREGFKKSVIEFFNMFSSLEITIEDMIAEGDLVATRETWKVIVASDKKALNGETMHFFKIRDGLITDEWSQGWEWLGAPVVLKSDSERAK